MPLPGPVFKIECVTAARRRQWFVSRFLFVLVLLLGLAVLWATRLADHPILTANDMVWVGEQFFYVLVGTQLVLVLLAAPALTSGAVCVDKARGFLTHLFVTDLSNAEIILGKWSARLFAVLQLLLSGLPVLLVLSLTGGIDLSALLGAYVVLVGVAVLTSTVSLTLSVWAHRTYEVVLATYLLIILWLLARYLALVVDQVAQSSIAQTLTVIDPFWLAFAPYDLGAGLDFNDYLLFLGGCLALSGMLLLLACWRVRSVSLRQAGQPSRPQRRRWPDFRWRSVSLISPRLDANPVLWREWHRRRPSRWLRIIWVVYAVVASLFSIWTIYDLEGGSFRDLAPFVNAFQVSIGLLFLTITAVTAFTDERVRGSLDVLLTTPLPASAIVWGKWRGAFRGAGWLAFWPMGIAVFSVLANERGHLDSAVVLLGLILSYCAFWTITGVALAVWISQSTRALVVGVISYLLVTVGMTLFLLAIDRHGDGSEGLAMVSTWFGPGQLTADLRYAYGSTRGDHLAWAIFWIIVHLGSAALIYLVTVQSFDRCLGRLAERERTRPW